MWEYLGYALFVALIIGCLRYVSGAFETEDRPGSGRAHPKK
jgi:hypothetical protein